MKITKDYQGLIHAENGDYVLYRDLISEEGIEIELDDRLVVRGDVQARALTCARALIADRSISAGWGISAGDGISAGCGISACRGISAGWGISAGVGISAGRGIIAGDGIRAGTFIDCKNRIFAGTSIFHNSEDCEKDIICAELRQGEICYGALKITKTENGNEEA